MPNHMIVMLRQEPIVKLLAKPIVKLVPMIKEPE